LTVYKYTGRTKTGAMKKGVIEAPNKNTAISKLRDRGINPRELAESKSILHREIELGGKVKNQDFVIYCRQFSTLIRAGISIVEATNILARQSTSKPLKKALEQVEEDIRTGIPFSEAVHKQPKIFPDLFVNMIRSGEVAGSIDITLERLANTFEKQYKLKKKVKSTLTYPAILLVLTFIIVVYLLMFIVPSFVATFEEMGVELPLITSLTVKLSHFMQSYWWLIFTVIIATIVLFRFLFRSNKEFHYTVHYFLLRIPIFGPLLQKTAIARLMRTLSSLFGSAVPILQALTISAKVSGNPVISRIVLDARSSLEKGSTLSEPFERSWIFPPLVTSMTQIGESTGSLDFMLEKLSDFYEDEVDRTVDTLKSLIEPIMILILGLSVGVIIAAIFVPMFSLYEQM